MKIISWIKALLIVIILSIINNSLFSQVVVERSKDKVIISGTPYYVHLVKKGETAYSISKAYGITVEELTKENPPAVFGINEGQALRVPVKADIMEISSGPVTDEKQHDETKFIYHNLRPGETVYSLSKFYGVSENEIILSNPGIDINNLSVDAEIAIPRREFMSDRQKFDNQEKIYFNHKVLKGESLASIAKKYGLPIRELRRENKNLRFPQVGDFIKVPGIEAPESPEIQLFQNDTILTIERGPIMMNRPAGFTPVTGLSGSLDVAVLLPFYLKENSVRTEIDSSKYSKGRKIYEINEKEEDWIYPWSLDFMEMYEGILFAVDTLRSLGVDINIYTYDIKSDTVELTKLIMSGKLAQMDIIIGPVYSFNLATVAAYGRELGIPVVSPVPLINNSVLLKNPFLFIVNSSLEIVQKTIARKVSEYYDHNFVFVHTDTSGVDNDVNRFKNLIFRELNYELPYEEIKFKEFLFYSRSVFNNESINRLSQALAEQLKNIVIIASEDGPVISEIITEIHGMSDKFDIKVFGYPAIRDIDNLDPEYYFDLDILVYSPYWIDYKKEDVKQFISDFRQKFQTEPLAKSYAWQGYDIAYYFLSGLAISGKDFIAHPEMHYPDLLQTEYEFRREVAENGFENHKLFLIRYTKDYEVELVDDYQINQEEYQFNQ